MVKAEQIFTMICSSMILFAALLMIGKFTKLNAISGFSNHASTILITKPSHSRNETCLNTDNTTKSKYKDTVHSKVISVLKSPLTLLGKVFRIIPLPGNQIKSSSSVIPAQLQANDHLYIDTKLLTQAQKAMINEVTSSSKFKSESLKKLGRQTGVEMDEFLVYRYFSAADWAPTYHGKKYD